MVTINGGPWEPIHTGPYVDWAHQPVKSPLPIDPDTQAEARRHRELSGGQIEADWYGNYFFHGQSGQDIAKKKRNADTSEIVFVKCGQPAVWGNQLVWPTWSADPGSSGFPDAGYRPHANPPTAIGFQLRTPDGIISPEYYSESWCSNNGMEEPFYVMWNYGYASWDELDAAMDAGASGEDYGENAFWDFWYNNYCPGTTGYYEFLYWDYKHTPALDPSETPPLVGYVGSMRQDQLILQSDSIRDTIFPKLDPTFSGDHNGYDVTGALLDAQPRWTSIKHPANKTADALNFTSLWNLPTGDTYDKTWSNVYVPVVNCVNSPNYFVLAGETFFSAENSFTGYCHLVTTAEFNDFRWLYAPLAPPLPPAPRILTAGPGPRELYWE